MNMNAEDPKTPAALAPAANDDFQVPDEYQVPEEFRLPAEHTTSEPGTLEFHLLQQECDAKIIVHACKMTMGAANASDVHAWA